MINPLKVGSMIEILMVEDNPADVKLTEVLLTESKVLNRLHVVSDGVEALAYLHQKAPYEDAVKPDLLLLDLNLPRMNGHELLVQVKKDPLLRSIPVIVLTTSDTESDISAAYNEYAAAFVTKPINLDRFAEIVKVIEQFWFSIVRFPPRGEV